MLYKNRTFLELYQKSLVNLISPVGVLSRAQAAARAGARAIAHALVPMLE